MENASKALLIAGGVLLAIIIISLLVRTYGNISLFQRQQVSAEEAERIESYNKEYTKYLNQYVYGTEVITAINKTINNNIKTSDNIEINIMFTQEEYKYYKRYYVNGKLKGKWYTIRAGSTLELKNDEDKYNFINVENDDGTINSNIEQLKNRAFKCTQIDFNNTTGKVNYIEFVEQNYKIKTDDEI